MNFDDNFINLFINLIEKCNDVILNVYNSNDFEIEIKNDNSPLTKADKLCNKCITKFLKENFKNIPIISEENPEGFDYNSRKNFEYCWLVDPLDGTKEFIKRNGQFTVNIGLVRNKVPIFGIVSIPVTGEIYYGIEGKGSFKVAKGITTKLKISYPKNFYNENVSIVASSSHLNKDTEDFINLFKNPKLIPTGSSIKLLLVAEGKADIYPRLNLTSEWDTCAAHAVVKYGGGKVLKVSTDDLKCIEDINSEKLSELEYNKENLLNSYFIVY
jgi:3'(2'), 5'-bisphosphate nucleotidase